MKSIQIYTVEHQIKIQIIKEALSLGFINFKKDILNRFGKNILLIDLENVSIQNDLFSNLIENHFELQKKYNSLLALLESDLRLLKQNLMDFFSEAYEVFEILHSIEPESFIVGGFNRDSLIGKTPKDVDFVSKADRKLIIEKFKSVGYEVDEIGIDFNVVMIKGKEGSYEIAQYRKDIYSESKESGANSVEAGSFEDDFQRRDFTINSLYYNPIDNILLDPTHQGWMDTKNRIVRFIGKPEDRIREDYLRGLRLFKFVKKGFKPDNKSLRAVRTLWEEIQMNSNPQRFREHVEYLVFNS